MTFFAAIGTVLILVSIYHVEGADPQGASCTSSFGCGVGSCCRSVDNRILSNNQMGNIFAGPMLTGHTTGTCSTLKAQKGEVCDGACTCDTGLTCYRPMSGMCCPPSTCVDDSYAKQQHAYWSNCMSNPNCAIPQ